MKNIHNYTLDELVAMGGKALNGKTTLFTINEINSEFDRRRDIYRAIGDAYALARYPTI